MLRVCNIMYMNLTRSKFVYLIYIIRKITIQNLVLITTAKLSNINILIILIRIITYNKDVMNICLLSDHTRSKLSSVLLNLR